MAHGRYTIVGKLADGGMAEIFLAMQHGAEGFQKPVVLKRVLTAFSADPQFRNMFLDEAHISMSLSHGNIVQVLDVGVSGDRTFLVLELVEGWDLEQLLERAGATGPDHPWPPSLALHVTAQICRALSYAHAKCGPDGRPLGIVHRDVSPNNVLISEQGEVKLADFGIAKADRKRERTLAGVIKGKIGFMSPEQALGRPLDARADIFSVGTLMYLMLTGRRPFDAGSELESMVLAQRAEYRPPEELNPYLSPEATAVVNRAMQREPEQRYQTADQMLVDVERVLRSQYHSAGQTELKLWLAELARRDHVPPIGRLLADAEAAPLFVDEGGELSVGTSLELSDFDGTSLAAAPTKVALGGGVSTPVKRGETDGSRGAPIPPPLLTTAISSAPTSPAGSTDPGGATDVRATLKASPVVPLPAPTGFARGPSPTGVGGRRRRNGRAGLGFALGALCMLGAVFGIRWLAQWAGRERMGITGWYRPSDKPPLPSVESPSDARPNVALLAATGDASALPVPRSPVPDTGTDSSVQARAAPIPQTVGFAPDAGRDPLGQGESAPSATAVPVRMEDEETLLLGRLMPDAATVIGEDEAEENPREKGGGSKSQGASQGAAATKHSERSAANPQKSPSRSPRAADSEKGGTAGQRAANATTRPQPVQIRITTSPLGAVVRTKKQVLGRTPLAIRFNPGNTYELTFVKSGYVTNNRKLSVSAGKPQSISVAMKKSPRPRRGFLRGR